MEAVPSIPQEQVLYAFLNFVGLLVGFDFGGVSDQEGRSECRFGSTTPRWLSQGAVTKEGQADKAEEMTWRAPMSKQTHRAKSKM